MPSFRSRDWLDIFCKRVLTRNRVCDGPKAPLKKNSYCDRIFQWSFLLIMTLVIANGVSQNKTFGIKKFREFSPGIIVSMVSELARIPSLFFFFSLVNYLCWRTVHILVFITGRHSFLRTDQAQQFLFFCYVCQVMFLARGPTRSAYFLNCNSPAAIAKHMFSNRITWNILFRTFLAQVVPCEYVPWLLAHDDIVSTFASF